MSIRQNQILWAVMVTILAISALGIVLRMPGAQAQEPKRIILYKIVDVPADSGAMQATLNEYGSAGWELVTVGLGEMTAPRLIFKK